MKRRSATNDELHYYRIRGIVCLRSNPACDEDWAKTVFDHVNSNDIPFTDDDEREGVHLIGHWDSPITHEEPDGELTTENNTLKGHPYHPGTRDSDSPDALRDRCASLRRRRRWRGKAPPHQQPCDLVGIVLFKPGVKEAVRKFKDPPRVRSRAMDIDIYP